MHQALGIVLPGTHLKVDFYSLAHQLVASQKKRVFLCFLLGLNNKVVRVVPVGQQVGGLLVVDAHVEIGKHAGEEVVDLSGDIQDVTHPANRTTCQLLPVLWVLILTS